MFCRNIFADEPPADQKHLDPRLGGAKTLMTKIIETIPFHFATDQSDEWVWTSHNHQPFSIILPFKTPACKPRRVQDFDR